MPHLPVLMALCLLVIVKWLPQTPTNFNGSYASLMKSVLSLMTGNKVLRNVSLRAALCFGGFQGMWAVLAFKMSQEPFNANSDIIGLLGLCGMVGAVTASSVGGAINRYGIKTFHLIGCAILLISWAAMFFFQNDYAGIIFGIVAIDAGMQCIQLSNQSRALSLIPHAANRINTIFMTTFFLGASLGTFIAGVCWTEYGWNGVVAAGIVMTVLSVLMTLFPGKDAA